MVGSSNLSGGAITIVGIIMYDDKANRIFSEMIALGLIPEREEFDITDDLLEKSYEIGNRLFARANKKRSPSDKRLHKKIAGINFLHLNNERSEIQTLTYDKKVKLKQKSGILYLIENPSFPEYIKVGITKDLLGRLNLYQTYDPHRSFRVLKYVFLQDVRATEKFLLEKYKVIDAKNGEWLPRNCLEQVQEYMNKF
jgi:hypothetical protein